MKGIHGAVLLQGKVDGIKMETNEKKTQNEICWRVAINEGFV